MQVSLKVEDILSKMKYLVSQKKYRAKVGNELAVEYSQLREEELNRERKGASDKDFERRRKSIERRFKNATADCSWEEFCLIMEENKIDKPAQEAIDLKLEELSKPIGELREKIAQKKADRDKFHKLYIEADKELGNINSQERQVVLVRKDFQKHWTPEKMVRFFLDPCADEFSRERAEFLSGLPGYEQWDANRSKVAKEQKRKAEQAQREKKQQQEYRKQFQQQAMKIINGRKPLPKELSNNYNHLTLPPNVLADFLRRKHEQQQVVG